MGRSLVVMCLLLVSPWLSAGRLAFSEAWEDHAIVTRPALPIVGEKAEIEVSVQCAVDAAGELAVTLSMDGEVIGEERVEAEPNAVRAVVFTYQPAMTGWKTAQAVATLGDDRIAVSRQIPVVAHRLYFPWFGFADKSRQTFVLERCRFANLVLSRDEGAYWRRRGVMAMRWRAGRWQPTTPGDTYGAYLADGLREALADGVMIDEIGGYDNDVLRDAPAVSGLREFCQQDRDFFLALWVPGVPKESLVNLGRNTYRKKGIDLLMFEVYNNYLATELGAYDPAASLKQRIEVARSQDVLYHSVITVGVKGQEKVYRLTNEELEDQVRLIRRLAPEMPGLGVYAAVQEGRGAELSAFADQLCGKYFVGPVLTVYDSQVRISNPTPARSDVVSLAAKVYNIGGMDSGPVEVVYHDGDPVGRGRKIGSVKLESIPARRDGGHPSGVVAEMTWKAGSRGAHEIFVEVVPLAGGDVLLDGMASRRLLVR